MQVVTTAIIKGGAGKTSTAVALAQAAAAAGHRVLAIDLDPQANMSSFIGADPNRPGSFHLLHGAAPEQVIQQTEQGIAAITASRELATEKTSPASAKRLQDAIKPIEKDFDIIVVDTPPQIGELTFNALQAATGLLIPLETDSSSLQGLYQIADIARQIQKRSNPNLTIKGIVLTRYDARPKLNRYMKTVIEAKGQEVGAPLIATIRAGIAIREAQAMRKNLFQYAPKSKPAQDYRELYERIIRED